MGGLGFEAPLSEPSVRFPFIVSIAFGALVAATTTPSAAQSAVQSADGQVFLVMGVQGPRVNDRRGYSTPLALPDEVVPENLVALRVGWLLAGCQQRVDDTELYLRRLDAGGLRSLPVPRGRTGRVRMSPVLLARDGELAGLVWLEGESRDSLAVRASRWLGITWSAPFDVSPAGGGSQLALDATVLGDGSWLLVWAGWDGEDDEILWSIVTDESATSPQPLSDNTVPDLLPTVLATEGGALAAWNTFDGDQYRVTAARLVEGRWAPAWTLETQTFFPHLERSDDVAHLLYFERSASDSAWVVAELGDEDRIVRRGRFPSPDNRRPLLLRDGDDVTLESPRDASRHVISWDGAR